MTLQQFRTATAALSGDINILVLSPWGDMEAAVIVTAADLAEGDPLIDDLRNDSLLLAGDAN